MREDLNMETTMKMKITTVLFFAGFLIFCSSTGLAQKSKNQNESLEREIRRLDLAEAEAILKKDFEALDRLAGADFTTNSPRNEIVKGKTELKELMRRGVVDYVSFVREVEEVLIYDKTVVTMGREIIVMGGDSPQKGQTIRRRYTNVWIRRDGKWLLSARHANIVCE
jgi:ketosteroid isomerase-like protein